MGEAVSTDNYTPTQRTRYRKLLAADLEIFDRHLQAAEFDDQGTIGLELELNLVDQDYQPTLANRDVLEHLSEEYQSEIGGYNLELNHPPLAVTGSGLRELEQGIDARLAAARSAAEEAGVKVTSIGTLPTVTTDLLEDEWITPEDRYRALNNAILESRGELVRIDLSDRERVFHDFGTIGPESTCTSMQLHLQVAPERFTSAWNASQAIAGVQVALAANSPLFLGHRLWPESRIPVFGQSIDTRTPELVTQGVRPRVWFGERWITSVFDLFEENVRYFSPLLAEAREQAGAPVMQGNVPSLHYLTLHNGTVWRWNRPIYSPSSDGSELAHLRVENRLLPAGPTACDMVADAAFYYGLVTYLARETRPVWSRLPFSDAERNFTAGARSGMFSRMTWPTLGTISVVSLVREHLIDQAREGLSALGVDQEVADHYLGIIDARAENRRNGATWQLRTLDALAPNSTPGSRERSEALAELTRLYLAHQETGKPVHTWEIGA